jgi:putative ABC transport system permease protein
MLNWITQIVTLTSFNVKTLPQRKGSAIAAIFGIAGVVAVFIGVLSIGHGFRKTMISTGADDTAMILRSGADSEMTSILSREDARLIAEVEGIAQLDGRPIVSPELFVIVNLPKKSTGTDANVPMRGVETPALAVRDAFRITSGRMFEWGRNEVIVGRGAALEFSGLELGNELRFGQNVWTVVGQFETGGGLAESEIWADASVLAPAYQRGSSYQSALVKLSSAGNFQQLKDALTSDPRLNLKVMRQTEYYAEQSRLLTLIITVLGTLIASLMALGAVFGALNTMYTAVAARSREIATLKALGFGSMAVVISVMIEALVLAAIGGAAGAAAAWLAFDGYRAATLNWQTFSQVAFAFEVGPALLLNGIFYAVVIGLIGGLFPAIRAARMPVATALREG